MIRIGLISTALLAAPAIAAPVNLKCEFDDRGKALPMELALDEDAATASFYWPMTGTAVKERANFLPNQVLFSSFTIDRASLQITRAEISGIPSITGQCAIVEIKRAF